MILLNQLFFNIMKGIYAHVKEDREKSRFDKQALGEVNKDTVLKYCLDINFPAKQDKLGFISGSKHEKIDVSELSKDFFLLHYLKSIETILANFCL